MVPPTQGTVTPEKNSDRRAWTTRNIHLLRQHALSSSGGTDHHDHDDHVNNGEDRARNEEDWKP